MLPCRGDNPGSSVRGRVVATGERPYGRVPEDELSEDAMLRSRSLCRAENKPEGTEAPRGKMESSSYGV